MLKKIQLPLEVGSSDHIFIVGISGDLTIPAQYSLEGNWEIVEAFCQFGQIKDSPFIGGKGEMSFPMFERQLVIKFWLHFQSFENVIRVADMFKVEMEVSSKKSLKVSMLFNPLEMHKTVKLSMLVPFKRF